MLKIVPAVASKDLDDARIVLETLPELTSAIALYRDLGFRETAPCLARPTPGALCLELRLS